MPRPPVDSPVCEEFELEADDEQARADREPFGHVVRWRQDAADEDRRVCERGSCGRAAAQANSNARRETRSARSTWPK